MRNVLQIAQVWIDSGEYVATTAKFSSPAIDRLEAEFGLHNEPWCAMFPCAAGREAVREGCSGRPWPMIASSQSLLAWFLHDGLVSSDPQDMLKWEGALAIRTNPPPDSAHGHVVLVKGRMTTAGKIVAIETAEGDTTGDGPHLCAANHRRVFPLIGGVWHYCDTSSLAGGDWWDKRWAA